MEHISGAVHQRTGAGVRTARTRAQRQGMAAELGWPHTLLVPRPSFFSGQASERRGARAASNRAAQQANMKQAHVV